MKLLLLFLSLIAYSNCLINPYRRYRPYTDGGDPGDPLYLTDLIRKGNLEDAKRLATVNHTDMNAIAPSYSGYLTVDKRFQSNMFFWYFPASLEPITAPVVLWLQGGPGASSLFGLFSENGPFVVLNE